MTTTHEIAPLSSGQLHRLCTELKQTLAVLYGNRLSSVVLYGSYVRGDFHPESDIDFLVVLHDETVRFGQEVWFMGEHVGELSHKYGLFISVKATSVVKFTTSDSAFYRAVRHQGKLL